MPITDLQTCNFCIHKDVFLELQHLQTWVCTDYNLRILIHKDVFLELQHLQPWVCTDHTNTTKKVKHSQHTDRKLRKWCHIETHYNHDTTSSDRVTSLYRVLHLKLQWQIPYIDQLLLSSCLFGKLLWQLRLVKVCWCDSFNWYCLKQCVALNNVLISSKHEQESANNN